MCTHDELDQQLREIHQRLLALPCAKGWKPVAETRGGALAELRQFIQRKAAVVEMLESLFRREESELVKLESQLCTLEEELCPEG